MLSYVLIAYILNNLNYREKSDTFWTKKTNTTHLISEALNIFDRQRGGPWWHLIQSDNAASTFKAYNI